MNALKTINKNNKNIWDRIFRIQETDTPTLPPHESDKSDLPRLVCRYDGSKLYPSKLEGRGNDSPNAMEDADDYSEATYDTASSILYSVLRTFSCYDDDIEIEDKKAHQAVNTISSLTKISDRLYHFDGPKIIRSEERATWKLKATNDTATISLKLPNSRTAPADSTALPGDLSREISPAYLVGNIIYPAPLLPDEISNYIEPDLLRVNIPLSSLSSNGGRALLSMLSIELDDKTEEKLSRVLLNPTISFATDNPYTDKSIVRLSVSGIGSSPAVPCKAELTSKGWAYKKSGYKGQLDTSKLEECYTLIKESGLFNNSRLSFSVKNSKIVTLQRLLRALSKLCELKIPCDYSYLSEGPADITIEAYLAETAKPNYFTLSARLNHKGVPVSFEEAMSQEMGGNYVFSAFVEDQGWRLFRFPQESIPGLNSILARAGTYLHALQIPELETTLTNNVTLSRSFRSAAANAIKLKNAHPARLPYGFGNVMQKHQIQGFQFLSFLSNRGLSGLLSDEMGLGKTLTILVWLLWLKQSKTPKNRKFRALVVTPKSVAQHWKDEIVKFNINLFASYLHSAANGEGNSEPELTVINYTQLWRQREHLSRTDWDAVVLDECQYIKNANTRTTKSAYALKAEHRVAVSGTPIENSLQDLFSICQFVVPDFLGNYATLKEKGLNKKEHEQALSLIKEKLQLFNLRRTHSDITSDRIKPVHETMICDLEDAQAECYLFLTLQALTSIKESSPGKILKMITRLRQIAIDPRVIPNLEIEFQNNFVPCKFARLIELVRTIMSKNEKAVIFSSYEKVLQNLKYYFETNGINTLKLTGKTRNREKVIKQFQEDSTWDVLLATLKTGGSGINLTAANHAIVLDPWWNRAAEEQALARIVRISQTREPHLYRFIAKGTIEERILELQEQKNLTFDTFIQRNNFNEKRFVQIMTDLLKNQNI